MKNIFKSKQKRKIKGIIDMKQKIYRHLLSGNEVMIKTLVAANQSVLVPNTSKTKREVLAVFKISDHDKV